MTKTKSDAEAKISELGDELKKQFEEIGAGVKDQLLKDFDKVLTSDMDTLKSQLGRFILQQNDKLLKQSQNDLQKAISQEFGGSVFGSILGGAILPSLFQSLGGGQVRSGDFKAAAAQGLLEMGKAIAKAQFRNG